MPTFTAPHRAWAKALKTVGSALSITFTAAALSVMTVAHASGEPASLNDALAEMSIGSPDAPVTLHEYSSLTCGHCGDFHTTTLPDIVKNYVDTGKVRIIFHDFPLGNLALAAIALTRCAGPERNLEMFDMLYKTQGNWTAAQNPLAALSALARFYGLSSDDVITCLSNEELRNAIVAKRDRDAAMYGIESTPSFILDGKLIKGNRPYDDFAELLDESLAAKGAN